MATAYTTPMAKHLEFAGIDIILVGDSIGMVEHGHANTLSVTLDELLIFIAPRVL